MKYFFSTLVLFLSSMQTNANAQPEIDYSGKVEWEKETATLHFLSSGAMPDDKEGFFWQVPANVKKIVIERNVQVTGGFRVLFRKPSNPLFILGKDRKSSIIYGTSTESWTDKNEIKENDKWKYSSISVIEDAVVSVSNLTLLNPRGYIISGYANKAVIHVDSCTLRDNRKGDNNNSDGFVGSAGSSIKNSLISTADDGIKVYNDISIENVTIEHHRNGAPLQFGWGGESQKVIAKIKNLKIVGLDSENRYNMAPFTWEAGQSGSRHVFIDGIEVSTKGQLYNEQKMIWQPLGLLEIKPEKCHFFLQATRAKLHGLPLGLNRSQGKVELSKSATQK